MIDNCGRSVADALNKRDLGRKRNILLRERHVDFPPKPLKNLNKVGSRLPWRSHAASHSRVKVMMGTYETR